MNPGTGRFWTQDSYEGNQENPLSAHKYLYCEGNPADGADPSGNAVYFVSRKLSISGGSILYRKENDEYITLYLISGFFSLYVPKYIII